MNQATDLSNLTLGQLAEMAVDIREQKKEIQKTADLYGQELERIKAYIYAKLVEADVDRVSVDGISLARSDNEVPQVTDWDAVNAYQIEHQLPDLRQRRISQALWNEMRQNGLEVPGIDVFVKQDVNIRKS